MPRPIALSDAQLTMIMQAAEPLQPADRPAFLEDVARELQAQKAVGDGAVYRAVMTAQRNHFDPPDRTGYIAHVERRRKARS